MIIFASFLTEKEIKFDLIPIPEFIKTLPGRNSSATHELVFLAFQLPPLGSKSYYIEVNNKSKITEVKRQNNENFIENQVNYIEYKDLVNGSCFTNI